MVLNFSSILYYDFLPFCCSAPEFDVSELESLFSATVPKPADSGKAGGRRKSVGSKPDKVHLVIQSFKFKYSHKISFF